MTITTAKAQERVNNNTTKERQHEFRLSMSDGSTLGIAGFWGMGLSDAITGTKRTDQKSSGVLSLGYRYSLGRFRVGADFGFAQASSKVTFGNEPNPYLKEKELNCLVLPTFEYVYFKRNIIELYGSAAAGVDFVRHSESIIVPKTEHKASDPSFETQFAFHVNPIGVRVGNDFIGGFVEAGLGYKGFITAGISLKF